MWRRLLDAPDIDLSSLRFADTGTSATPPELLSAIAARCSNAQMRVFYGSTEAGNVASLHRADISRKPGSVGVPSPSTSVRVTDDGELWVRGPLLFDGYFGEPDPFLDGWYPTGDLADLDAEGYLSIAGRAREVIRTGGETVAPVEVEAVLARCAGVADVAVVGLPDATWGEVVCAVVVGSVTLDDLRAHCKDALASFKQPRRLELVDEIPRTASTGQVQRRLLVERFSR